MKRGLVFFLIFFKGTGENINQSVELPLDKVGFEVFFCLDAAWLNEGRCRGGRPSVSEN